MLTRKIIQQKTQLVVNLPKQVCDDFNWHAGDLLRIFIVARGVVQMEKVTPEQGEYKRPRENSGETGESKNA